MLPDSPPARPYLEYGDALGRLRACSGLTFDAAASRSGLARRAIQRYEWGQRCPSLCVLLQLVAAYGATLIDFYRLVGRRDGTPPRAKLRQFRVPLLRADAYAGKLRSQGIDCDIIELDASQALIIAAVLFEE